ncbi:MAG: hypothetical protein ABSE46_03805 [Terracidiphilus sp.]|jgi:hypothetical protein
MLRSAKTVSVGELQAAIKNALDATKKTHPDVQIQPALAGDGYPFWYRPYWLCGGPFFPPDYNLNQVTEYAKTFTVNLSKDPAVAPLAIDGKFESAVYITGGKVAVGFVPGEASLTE